MNLPALYARVVTKRPELAVPNVTHKADWWYGKVCGLSPHIAAALILAKWVEELPCGSGLMRADRLNLWYISHTNHHADTPIEALAAFYLGEQA